MFSEPELKTEPAFGFRSVFVTIEVSDVEATPFNPAAVALLNDIIGAAGPAELDNPDAAAAEGRASSLLHWVYSLFRQQRSPVFQLGVFESLDGGDLEGTYHLPTRPSSPFDPANLLKGLLEKGLLLSAEDFDADALREEVKTHQAALGAKGAGMLHRRLVLTLLQRGHQVTEVTQAVHRLKRQDGDLFFANGIGQGANFLLNDILAERASTNRLLAASGVPVVRLQQIYNPRQITGMASAFGFPLVLKPNNVSRPLLPLPVINNVDQLTAAIEENQAYLNDAVIEHFMPGDSLSIVVMGGEVLWCAKRSHVVISGDGKTTLEPLLQRYCAQEFTRDRGFKNAVDFTVFLSTHRIPRRLRRLSLDSDTVLMKGAKVQLTDHPLLDRGAAVRLVDLAKLGPEIEAIIAAIQPTFGDATFGIDLIAEEGADGYLNARVLGAHLKPQVPPGQLMEQYIERFIALAKRPPRPWSE